jgi:hypothetical protein
MYKICNNEPYNVVKNPTKSIIKSEQLTLAFISQLAPNAFKHGGSNLPPK